MMRKRNFLILAFCVLFALAAFGCKKRGTQSAETAQPTPAPVVEATPAPSYESAPTPTPVDPAVEEAATLKTLVDDFKARNLKLTLGRYDLAAPGTYVCELYEQYMDIDQLIGDVQDNPRADKIIPALDFKIADLEVKRIAAAKLLVSELLAVGENSKQNCDHEEGSVIDTDSKLKSVGSVFDFLSAEKITAAQIGIKPEALRATLISVMKAVAQKANKHEDFDRTDLTKLMSKFNVEAKDIGLKELEE